MSSRALIFFDKEYNEIQFLVFYFCIKKKCVLFSHLDFCTLWTFMYYLSLCLSLTVHALQI